MHTINLLLLQASRTNTFFYAVIIPAFKTEKGGEYQMILGQLSVLLDMLSLISSVAYQVLGIFYHYKLNHIQYKEHTCDLISLGYL